MPPGMTRRPSASMTRASEGTMSRPAPTARITPSTHSTSAAFSSSWVTTVPPLMRTLSFFTTTPIWGRRWAADRADDRRMTDGSTRRPRMNRPRDVIVPEAARAAPRGRITRAAGWMAFTVMTLGDANASSSDAFSKPRRGRACDGTQCTAVLRATRDAWRVTRVLSSRRSKHGMARVTHRGRASVRVTGEATAASLWPVPCPSLASPKG